MSVEQIEFLKRKYIDRAYKECQARDTNWPPLVNELLAEHSQLLADNAPKLIGVEEAVRGVDDLLVSWRDFKDEFRTKVEAEELSEKSFESFAPQIAAIISRVQGVDVERVWAELGKIWKAKFGIPEDRMSDVYTSITKDELVTAIKGATNG